MFDRLDHADYEKMLNTKFVVKDAENLEIELFDVTELKETSQIESFSLYFRGARDRFLPQKLYQLSHETFETGELFLVPCGQDEQGIHYQAVFNRLKKTKAD